MLVGQMRLLRLSDYLEEVVPVCRKRGDKFYMKGIQALAFVRRAL